MIGASINHRPRPQLRHFSPLSCGCFTDERPQGLSVFFFPLACSQGTALLVSGKRCWLGRYAAQPAPLPTYERPLGVASTQEKKENGKTERPCQATKKALIFAQKSCIIDYINYPHRRDNA